MPTYHNKQPKRLPNLLFWLIVGLVVAGSLVVMCKVPAAYAFAGIVAVSWLAGVPGW